MLTIDVDSHFDVELDQEHHPLRSLLRRIPRSASEMVLNSMVGDLRSSTAQQDIPDESFVPGFLPDRNLSAAEQVCEPGTKRARFPSGEPSDRLAWLDAVGIDHAFLNPGALGFTIGYFGAEQWRAIRLCNDCMADHLSGHTDRLIPVSLVDWSDIDRAVEELARMREKGSRAFWVRAEPLGDRSPGHPSMDRLWSAATDLGMVGILHVGQAPVRFDGGWGNQGWNEAGGAGGGGYFRYANALRHQAAEMLFAAMLFGGTFGRNPALTIISQELNVGWLPYFLWRVDSLSDAGPWPFDMRPSEMARRNLRATPLPGLGDTDIGRLLTTMPDALVFSSDFPHGEGSDDPVRNYDPILQEVAPQTREAFFGTNIEDCFARMGDPLSLAR